MDYNPLSNDGHCRGDTANKAIDNVEYGKCRKQRNKARRAITALFEYLHRIGFYVESIVIHSRDGKIKLTENDRYKSK